MMTLEQYIYPTQEVLFKMLEEEFGENCYTSPGNYILVEGEAPIMLVAHLDTVHKEPVKIICKSKGGKILMSPQGIGGDDRCGVYALNSAYTRSEVKPWLLFTCNEEIGGGGASAFVKDYDAGFLPSDLDTIKAIIEIDRRGKDDAVYYDCDNIEFEDYITSKGFTTAWGSFSDISLIAPAMGIAAVNLSSGYYNAHTQHEYIDKQELNNTIGKVLSIVNDAAKSDFPFYEYIEAQYTYSSSYGGKWSYYGAEGWSAYDYDDDDVYDSNWKIVPKEIAKEYDALVDLHSKKELDSIRKEMGDEWIKKLFEAEYGGTYDQVFEDTYSDEDDEKEM